MGNVCPPRTTNTQNDNIDINQVNASQTEAVKVDDPNEYDKLAVDVLRTEFRDDPQMFILNRLLMSYMFFEDYTEEIRVLHHETSPTAQQLNSTLIEGHKKQFFMPDSILETINKRVKFEHSSGPKKGITEPLATQRLIIIHDNIEVIENIDYETIDKPSYRATVENSKYTGFLRVNISETENLKNSKRQSEDSAYSAPSITHNKRKSIINPFIPNEEFSEIARNDSGVSTAANSDPEYEYSRITTAQTPQNIVITEIDANTNTFQLPASCIVKFKEKNIDLDIEDDEEDGENMENNLFIYKYYLNSSEFMKHFKNTVFPNCIGELLGFSKNCIQIAKSIPGAMFCNRKDYSNPFWELGEFTDSMVEFEVIPAIFLPWPKSIIEWTMRKRTIVYEQKESKRITYTWPNKKMIDRATSEHAVIVPKGFMPKKHENSQMHLEWEVRFPKIERYLEFRMSHAQTRVFLYLIVLFKKFIEPITQMHGLSMEHLRFLIFWQCEENYRDWFEDRLGKKTLTVLNKLYEYLGKGEMSHYFIKSRNMLENIPRKYLISNQEIIHDILESPVSYFFCALKDLRYSDKFYPQPDIEELEDILKSETVLNIGIPTDQSAVQIAKENKKKNKVSKPRLDSEQMWNKKFDEIKRINAQIQQEAEEKDKKNLGPERPKLSLDVNTNFKKKLRSTSMETIERRILVLTYFIKHFIEIAQTSLKISSADQTMFYLKQAYYLTKLLGDIESDENVRKFQAQIKFEEENCAKKMLRYNKQNLATPRRSSAAFGFHSDIVQVKGKNINLANLNMAYEDLKRNDDANSITSNLENRDVDNIEVIADVHSETVKKNQRNEDFESYPTLVPYTNDDDEMNDIFNDLENVVEMENRKKDDDKIEWNHLRSFSEPAETDHTKYFLNRIRNNSTMVIFGNQNEDAIIDTTNDLEKFEVEDDEVNAERHIIPGFVTYPPIGNQRNDEDRNSENHIKKKANDMERFEVEDDEVNPERHIIPGFVTYPPIGNQRNDDDRNSENHIKKKTKQIKFNDEIEATDHLKKTTFENDDIDDQKNDDNSTIVNKRKPFFRIQSYEDRNME